MKTSRIVYLAVAAGRGHLVRAHRVRALFASSPFEIDIATTSVAGQSFLASLGCPSWVLPGGFDLPFDERHAMNVPALHASTARYCVRGRGRDVRALQSRGASLFVNDSLHPALLVGNPEMSRTILVHGDTMEEALLGHFDASPLERAYRSAIRQTLDRAAACVHHSAFPERAESSVIRLPPLLSTLRASDEAVRRHIGAPSNRPIACVYLNPHFRDPDVAAGIEKALRPSFHLHAVGEGYAGRPGWISSDAELPEVIARASVVVSGAGMAALAEARRSAVPFLAIVGEQPEQTRNLERASRALGSGEIARALVAGLDRDGIANAVSRAASDLDLFRARSRAEHRDASPDLWRSTLTELFSRRLENHVKTSTGDRSSCPNRSHSSSKPTIYATGTRAAPSLH